jgi:hypothetical protein
MLTLAAVEDFLDLCVTRGDRKYFSESFLAMLLARAGVCI